MATLQHRHSGVRVFVEPEFVIGRSPSASLRLKSSYVSGHHAAVRWIDSRWEVRDFSSRNGTKLGGRGLLPGQPYPIARGAELSFGHDDELWELVDDSAPLPMAVPMDGGPPVIAAQSVVGLPDDDDPAASLLRDRAGRWRLESIDGDSLTFDKSGTFEIAGKQWRFCLPETIGATSSLGEAAQQQPVVLRFSVSRDEEYVELEAVRHGRTLSLGSRMHNYLLLTLARSRLEDSQSGVPSAAGGWTHVDDLEQALKTSAAHLNMDIFRIRQHFARAGLNDAVNIIERRQRAKQLRIGTDALEIRVI